MVLIFHIVVAVSSLIYTGYLYIHPSANGIKIAYAFVAGMLVSGFYLTLKNPAHMTQSCVMGLVYLALVSYGLVVVRRKLVVPVK